jgi:hypothetical protein
MTNGEIYTLPRLSLLLGTSRTRPPIVAYLLAHAAPKRAGSAAVLSQIRPLQLLFLLLRRRRLVAVHWHPLPVSAPRHGGSLHSTDRERSTGFSARPCPKQTVERFECSRQKKNGAPRALASRRHG